MTFEAFDAAMLIETAGFSPNILALPDSTPAGAAGTLEAALQQTARGPDTEPGARAEALLDRAALRAEAGVLDLWTQERGGARVQALHRPGPGLWADTSWRAWALDIGEDAPAPAGHAGKGSAPLSANLDKPPPKPDPDEEDNEVVVKGTRPKIYDEGGLDGVPSGDPGGAQTTGPSVAAGEDQPNDCRDRQALAAEDEIKAKPDYNHYEYGSLTYRDASGAVQHSDLIRGDFEKILPSQIRSWMNSHGVSFSQVIGWVHNHPTHTYGGPQADINRYPSGGDVPGGDWNVADWFVSQGAGGVGGEGFALYIIDTEGDMREFEYKDREIYMNLDATERGRGEHLPGEIVSDGTSCG